MKEKKPYPLRIESVTMEKFKHVAAENGRSVNKEVEMLMKQAVQDYERLHGPIALEDPSESDE